LLGADADAVRKLAQAAAWRERPEKPDSALRLRSERHHLCDSAPMSALQIVGEDAQNFRRPNLLQEFSRAVAASPRS